MVDQSTPTPPQMPAQQPSRPQQTANIITPKSKISMKSVAIGCGLLVLMVIGGLSIVFYNLMNNPTQLSSVGLDPSTTKTLLQTFSILFFGLLTFLGIGFLVINLYRIITVKNVSRLRYIFGAFFGFIIFMFAIVIGARIIILVNNFSVENIMDSDKLIMPYLQIKDDIVYTRGNDAPKLIAPATIYYELNPNYFRSIISTLGQVNFTDIVLDCGNGQKLPMDFVTYQFKGSCMYFQKGEYALNIEASYINIPTSEKFSTLFTGGSILFDSQITVQPTKGDLMFNDAATEMIVGETPSKVIFDANAVFTDLGLTGYTILWDFDGDGQQDKQNDVTTTFVYNQAQLYNVYIRFPGLNDYIYTFPVRVQQSDTPVCEVIVTKTDGKNYTVTTHFFDQTVKITDYKFDILDRANKNTIVDTRQNTNGAFVYQFQDAGTFAIQNTYLTEDDKQGQCESDDIQIGASDFDITYTTYAKSAQSPQFQKVVNEGDTYYSSGVLVLSTIPTVIKIQITQISPDSTAATKKVMLDGKQLISSEGNVFEATIQDSKNHEMLLVVEDKTNGAKTEIKIPIQVNRADIIGKLLVTPDTVGTDPFTVKFDASTTIINDPDDEIVLFTRDFGDGTGSIKKDFSEAIMTHTYRYDTVHNNGTYHPILTIKTKKGREVSISPENNIIVKRANQTLPIHIDSHPAQVAKAGDKVDFSIEVNGLPSKITRDFGNGKTLTCDTRQSCGSTSYIYTDAGTYVIRANVAYENQPTIEGNITLKVNP